MWRRSVYGAILPQRVGAGGGGAGSHRYWRLKNFTGSTSFFETSEIQLLAAGVVKTGGITPTASVAPGFGLLLRLTDGVLTGNQVYWTTTNANTLVLTWDLAAPAAIDAAKIARYDTAGRYPTSCALDYSDNGADWTGAGTGTPVEPGTNFTLSAEIAFA